MDERENYKNLPVQDKRECNMEKISETEPLAMEDLANDKKESHPDYSESVNDCANNGQVILFSLALFYVVVNIHILQNFIVLWSRLGVIFSHCMKINALLTMHDILVF